MQRKAFSLVLEMPAILISKCLEACQKQKSDVDIKHYIAESGIMPQAQSLKVLETFQDMWKDIPFLCDRRQDFLYLKTMLSVT